MTKEFKLIINADKDQQSFDIQQGMGAQGRPIVVKANPGVRYQLVDTETNLAPKTVRAKRVGKSLQVFFEDSQVAELIIDNYYEVMPPGYNGLIGELQSGIYYEYVPQSASLSDMIPALSDGGQLVQVVLGGSEIAAFGTGVSTLLPLNPFLAGAILGGGVAAAAGLDTTPDPLKLAPTAPVVPENADGGINAAEAANGTPVEVSLAGTNAVAGDVVKVIIDGVSTSYTLLAADITAGRATVSVPKSVLDAAGQGPASVTWTLTGAAGNTSTASPVATISIDTLAPAAPTAPVVPENADGGINATEAADGTPVQVSLGGTNAVAGDVVKVIIDGVSTSYTLLPADITAGLATVTVPKSVLDAAGQGPASVTWTLTDAAGNTSPASPETAITLDTPLIVQGNVSAGPMFGGATIEVYDNQGNLLGSAPIQEDGSWRVTIPGMANYRGAILVKAVDANSTGVNFNDEVTGAQKSLDVTLRAMGAAQEGNNQFSTTGSQSVLNIYISPVTELAVRKAGVSGDTAPASTQDVLVINAAVGQSLGLSGVDITSAPTTTNSGTFNSTDGLNAGEKYGLVLAKLSGLDALNGGSIGVSLELLEGKLSGQGASITLTLEGLALVDQGRQKALDALKSAPSTGEKTFVVDTPLNRQLLGDVVVTDQSVTADNRVVITGTALPGSSVSVTLPDGTVQATQAGADGNFAITSTNAQPAIDTPLKLEGQDGLSLPAILTAPSAPVIDTDNGKVVAGTGQPGTVVEIFVLDANGQPLLDANGQRISLGQVNVDAAGHWSLTPAEPLSDNTSLQARTIDAAGNVSAPGKGVVDIDLPGLSIAEAADGYINAAEKASDGGLALQITVPASALAGDVITTVLTLPNGDIETLTRTVTADDIGKTVTQIIPAAALAQDGLNKTAVTITTTVGTSATKQQTFIVDTTPPPAPSMSPSNGQIINGTAEPGTTVTVRDGAGTVLGSAPVGTDGNWTLFPDQPLPDGLTLTATATDPAGNASVPGLGLVQAGALLITGAVDNIGPVFGLVADGAVTNDTSPQLAGTFGTALQAGQSAVVYRRAGDGSLIELGVASVQGNAWTFQDGQGAAGSPTAALVDGNYTYVVKIQTAAGPVAGLEPSGEFDLTVLTSAPAAPATRVPEANDAHVNPAERNSDGGVPVVTTLAAGARVGDSVTTVVTNPNGTQTTLNRTLTQDDISAGQISQLFPASALTTDGAYSASTTLTSSVTGLTSLATVNTFTLDTLAPTSTLANTSAGSTVNLTESTAAAGVVSVSTENAATWSMTLTGTAGSVTKTGTGTGAAQAVVLTAADIAALGQGAVAVSVTATDAAGNAATVSTGGNFTLDTVAPAVPTIGDLTDDVGSSTGSIAAGAVTDDTRPTLSGTAPADATSVNIYNGNALLGSAVVAANGTWTFTPTAAMGSGPHAWSATSVDAAGNESGKSATREFTLVGAAPAAPAITQVLDDQAPLTVALQKDAVTNDATPVVSGSGTVGTTVNVYSNNALVGTTTVKADGTWSLATSNLGADGLKDITAQAVDAAGQTSPSTGAYSINLDTTAPYAGTQPPALVISDDQGAATGPITAGGTTDDSTPTFSGSGQVPGDVVTVKDGSTTLGTATVQADGTWSLTPTTPLAEGAHSTSYTVTDPAGNTSPASDAVAFTIDSSAVVVTISKITDNVDGVQGDIANNGLTNDTTPTLVGTATPGAVVTVKEGSTTLGTVTANASGAWSFTTPAQAGGAHTYTATAANAAGTTGTASFQVSIDSTAPTQPSLTGLSVNDDVGLIQGKLSSGDTTDDTTPTLSGSGATPGELIKVYDGTNFVGSATVGADGNWTLTVPAPGLTVGAHSLSFSATDAAGNESAKSDPFNLTVDTEAPTAPTAPVVAENAGGGINSAEAANGTPVQVSLAGTNAVAGDVVNVTVDGFTTPYTLLAEDITAGTATVTVPKNVLDAAGQGEAVVTATITDAAGNTSAASPATPITIDTLAPTQTPTIVSMSKDTGITTGGVADFITVDGSAGRGVYGTLSAALAAGEKVQASFDGGTTWLDAGTNGTQWEATDLSAHAANWTLQARVVDAAGNVGSNVQTQQVTLVDATAPVITQIGGEAAFSNTYTTAAAPVNATAITDNTLVVKGTGVEGSTIRLYDNNSGNQVGTATVAAGGNWSVDLTSTALGNGTHNFYATQTGVSGFQSVLSNSHAVTISAPNTNANLLIDGDFVNSLASWTLVSGDVNALANGRAYGNLISGRAIDMYGDYAAATIRQTVSGLQVGQTYTVSVKYSHNGHLTGYGPNRNDWVNNLDSLEVSLSGAASVTQTYTIDSSVFTIDPVSTGVNFPWATQSFTFTAASTSATLSLKNLNGGTVDSAGVLVDTVTLQQGGAPAINGTLAAGGTLGGAVPAAPVITHIGGEAAFSNTYTTPTSPVNATAITDNTLVVRGMGEAGSFIKLFDNSSGNLVGTATVAAGGAWSVDLTGTPLGNGTHNFYATQTNTVGVQSVLSNSHAVTVNATLFQTTTNIYNNNFETTGGTEKIQIDQSPGVYTGSDPLRLWPWGRPGTGEYSLTWFANSKPTKISFQALADSVTYTVISAEYLGDEIEFYSAAGVLLGTQQMVTSANSIDYTFVAPTGTAVAYMLVKPKPYTVAGNDNWGIDNIVTTVSSLAPTTTPTNGTLTAGAALGTATPGNDSFTYASNAAFLSAVAGVGLNGLGGVDTVKLASTATGQTLDLSAMGLSRYSKGNTHSIDSIEVIDITGGGANGVKLSVNDILHMAGGVDQLNGTAGKVQMAIIGDSNDKVLLSGIFNEGNDPGVWINTGTCVTKALGSNSSQTFNVWEHIAYDASGNAIAGTSDAQLLIDSDISDVGLQFTGTASDDSLVLNASSVTGLANTSSLVSGGAGSDTLKLDGSGINFDLTALTGKVLGMEKVDLTGWGDNTLKLALADVLAVSDSDQLCVLGNAGDVVNIAGGAVSASTQTVDGVVYNAYNLNGAGLADLFVQQGVTVAFVL